MVVGLDTCTRWLGIAVCDRAGTVLGQVHEEFFTHTTHLIPALDRLLLSLGLQAGQIGAVGVIRGPGSFTGLRVGLAAAEGLSQTLGVPAFSMGSLTALAVAAAEQGEGMALLDARRGQVYCCRYVTSGGECRAVGDPHALSPAEVSKQVGGLAWAVGDGVSLLSGWPEGCRVRRDMPNLAVAAALDACRRLNEGCSPGALEPLYIRPPDARLPGSV